MDLDKDKENPLFNYNYNFDFNFNFIFNSFKNNFAKGITFLLILLSLKFFFSKKLIKIYKFLFSLNHKRLKSILYSTENSPKELSK
jgi:hypothetical protein